LWLGLALRRIGLLRTPEETTPPVVVERANALAAELAGDGHDHDDALLTIWADPALRAAHESFLPEAPRPRRGEVDVDQAVATAKLAEAQTFEDASAWLRPRECLAVLGDRALIAALVHLPNAGERPNAA
jgi:membrane glycosyltransferase